MGFQPEIPFWSRWWTEQQNLQRKAPWSQQCNCGGLAAVPAHYGFNFNILLCLSCSKLQKRPMKLHWGKTTGCCFWCCISALFCTTSSGAYKEESPPVWVNSRWSWSACGCSGSRRRQGCLCRQAASREPFSFDSAEPWRGAAHALSAAKGSSVAGIGAADLILPGALGRIAGCCAWLELSSAPRRCLHSTLWLWHRADAFLQLSASSTSSLGFYRGIFLLVHIQICSYPSNSDGIQALGMGRYIEICIFQSLLLWWPQFVKALCCTAEKFRAWKMRWCPRWMLVFTKAHFVVSLDGTPSL